MYTCSSSAPNAHLGGGGNRIGRCRDLGKGELLRRRDHALEVRARRSPSPAHIGKHSHPAVLEFSSTHELQVPLVHFLGQLEWVPDLAASLDGDADPVRALRDEEVEEARQGYTSVHSSWVVSTLSCERARNARGCTHMSLAAM